MKNKELYVEVANRLVHDTEADTAMILEQIARCREADGMEDVIAKLGRLLYDILPSDKKHDITNIIKKDRDHAFLVFYIAQYMIAEKEYDKAVGVLYALAVECEAWHSSGFQFQFDDIAHMFLYHEVFKPEKDLALVAFPMNQMYRAYAYALYQLKDYEACIKQLQLAQRYNPVDTETLLELAEVYKITEDFDAYQAISIEALNYCFDTVSLARCYRNLGYVYLMQAKWDTASAMYYMSLVFDKHDIAMQALYKIYETTKQEPTTPSLEELQMVMDAHQISFGASQMAVDTLLQLAKEYDERYERDTAIEYLNKAYLLTNDDSIHAVMEEMRQNPMA